MNQKTRPIIVFGATLLIWAAVIGGFHLALTIANGGGK